MVKRSVVLGSTKTKESSEENSRRQFLGKAAVIAAGFSFLGSTTASGQKETHAAQRLSTPISKLLKLSPADEQRLTPAVRKLTPNDLAALARGEFKGNATLSTLTVQDLKSLNEVIFVSSPSTRAKPIIIMPGGGCDGTCCCCCCCCAVAMQPSEAITII